MKKGTRGYSGARSLVRRLPVLVAVVALGGVASTGVSTAASRVKAAKPTLSFGLSSFGIQLDPAKDGTGLDELLHVITYEPLITENVDGTFSPALATSWHYLKATKKSLQANKHFQIVLRHDARFSDGSRVTAQAVVKSLKYYATAGGPFAGSFLGPNPKFSSKGKWVVNVDLTVPNPNLPLVFSDLINGGYVIGPAGLANPSSLGSSTDGAGPYALDAAQSVANDHYTFVPNPYYYDKSSIKYGKIVLHLYPSASTLLQAATTGQVQVAVGDATTAAAAKAAGLHVLTSLGPTVGIYLLDRRPGQPLSSVQVRQALNYAVDRKAITHGIVGGLGAPTSELATLDGFDPKYNSYYSYDPTKAKQLLASAGFPNGFSLKLTVQANNYGAATGQAVAQYFDAIGVQTDVTVPVDNGTWAAQRSSGQYPAFHALFPDYSMGVTARICILANSAWNQYKVNDPIVEANWIKSQRASNPNPYYQAITDEITKNALWVPLFRTETIYYVANNVGGVELTSHVFVPSWPTTWFPK